MAFILLGRANCANCNATKGMIHDGKIPVRATDYVMADLNIDDARTEGDFMRKFRKENSAKFFHSSSSPIRTARHLLVVAATKRWTNGTHCSRMQGEDDQIERLASRPSERRSQLAVQVPKTAVITTQTYGRTS